MSVFPHLATFFLFFYRANHSLTRVSLRSLGKGRPIIWTSKTLLIWPRRCWKGLLSTLTLTWSSVVRLRTRHDRVSRVVLFPNGERCCCQELRKSAKKVKYQDALFRSLSSTTVPTGTHSNLAKTTSLRFTTPRLM